MALSRLSLPSSVSDRVAFALPTSVWVSVFTAFFFVVLRRRLGWCPALGATGLLFFHPRWFAHSHMAEYDIQIAMVWWAAAVSFHWANSTRLPKRTIWSRSAVAAFFFALALSVKIHAFFLPFPFLFWVLLFQRWQAWRWALLSAFMGPLLYLASQPYLWWNTAERLGKRLLDYGEKLPINVFYFGEVYPGNLPWHYAWVLLGVTLPVGFLVLFVLGMLRFISSATEDLSRWIRGERDTLQQKDVEEESVSGSVAPVVRGPERGGDRLEWMVFLLLNAVATPILFTWKSPYDGIRLFLAALPFLAMIGAEGIGLLEERLRLRFGEVARRAVPAAAVLLVGCQAFTCYQLHPFQLAHYSALVGGVRGAHHLGLETTYWADAITPGFVAEMADRLPEDANLWLHALDPEPLLEYQRQGTAPQGWRFNEEGLIHAHLVHFRQGFFGPGQWQLVSSERPWLLQEAIHDVPLVRVYRGP